MHTQSYHVTTYPVHMYIIHSNVASYICFITIIAVGVMKSLCEKTDPDELGRFCLTPSQVPIIFNSGEGKWHALTGK